MENDTAKGDYSLSNEIPIEMSESEKTTYKNYWITYQEKNDNPENHRGRPYSIILWQCTQLFQYKMNQDTAWNTTITS